MSRVHTRSCWYYYTTHTHIYKKEYTRRIIPQTSLLVRFNPTANGDVVRGEFVLGHERLVTALKFEVIPEILAIIIIQTLLFAFVAFRIRFREQTYRVSRVEDARATSVIKSKSIRVERSIDPSNNPIHNALRRTGDEITLAFVRFERQRAIRRGNGERDGDKGG